MRRSITTRLIVLLTFAAALILGGGMLLDYRLSRQEILKRLADEATIEVRVVVGDMENWLNGIEATTRLLGRVLEQREYSQQGLKQMLVESLGMYAAAYENDMMPIDSDFLEIGPPHMQGIMAEHLYGRGATIFGGSNEIQRNILSRMLLGT